MRIEIRNISISCWGGGGGGGREEKDSVLTVILGLYIFFHGTYFTSTETVRFIRDREPRMVT